MSELNPAPNTGADEQRIRERAFVLWEQAGCPEGQADEFWNLAQQEISMQSSDGPLNQKQPALAGIGNSETDILVAGAAAF